MLVVSRALMGSPRVLLLDEMMTGLAPLIVAELARTVSALAAEGVAVLIAEPAIGAVRNIIERGYVLVRGSIVAQEENGGQALDDAYRTALGIERPATVRPA
jgi:branched-chain amino acid transport system ATP-binding protein